MIGGSGSTVVTARKWSTCCRRRPRVGRHWRELRCLGNRASRPSHATWKRGTLHREIPLGQGRVDFEFPKTCARNDWEEKKNKKRDKKWTKCGREKTRKNSCCKIIKWQFLPRIFRGAWWDFTDVNGIKMSDKQEWLTVSCWKEKP